MITYHPFENPLVLCVCVCRRAASFSQLYSLFDLRVLYDSTSKQADTRPSLSSNADLPFLPLVHLIPIPSRTHSRYQTALHHVRKISQFH